MKALILAGGFGTRLKDISGDVPKPMISILGKPFLEHQINFLKDQGINEIILAVYYMSEKIKSYFGTGHRWGVSLTYSEEEFPLGTAGAIKKAGKYIDDTFLVLNGDSYSQININDFVEFHRRKMSDFTIALTSSKDCQHYGSVTISGNKITGFIEKGSSGNSIVNSGIYIFEPKILDLIESDKYISLEKEIFPKLVKENILWGYRYKGYFMDIGRPKTYQLFKNDVLKTLFLKENCTVRNAMSKISKSGINLLLVTDIEKRLLGVINDRILREFMISGGNLDDSVCNAMIKNPVTVKAEENKDVRNKLLMSGINHLPVLDKDGRIIDVDFRIEKINLEKFPIIRGKAPLRISFGGGGTDLPYFFEKHGGVVINSTIDKYCYATMIKRADSKIIINSDIEDDLIIDSIHDIEYDGRLDLIKASIKSISPNFGFDLYLYNDVPPERGLGSSATVSVLIIKLLAKLQGVEYDDYKIAELAYKVEREILKIKGGWQDQYAAITGGFNFMEFTEEKTIIYPLKLKNNIVDELNQCTLLCYVGSTHSSGEMHEDQEKFLEQNEKEKEKNLHNIKRTALEIKDCLLTDQIQKIGPLLKESWENKKVLGSKISNPKIDKLYETGIMNGAYGGKLLGAGGGGYILFFYSPIKRNILRKSLEKEGGEIMDFNFEFEGAKIWNATSKF